MQLFLSPLFNFQLLQAYLFGCLISSVEEISCSTILTILEQSLWGNVLICDLNVYPMSSTHTRPFRSSLLKQHKESGMPQVYPLLTLPEMLSTAPTLIFCYWKSWTHWLGWRRTSTRTVHKKCFERWSFFWHSENVSAFRNKHAVKPVHLVSPILVLYGDSN